MKQYVFGYGSLLDRSSRLGTVPLAKDVFPVRLQGMVRGWWARTKVTGFSTTYVGCLDANDPLLKNTSASGWVNGIIFEVGQADLEMLDEREKNYCRKKIDVNRLSAYMETRAIQDFLSKDTEVWAYLNSFQGYEDFAESRPTKMFPIVQSYVDICLNGCLELEASAPGFIVDFITTTWGWGGAWANDRICPRRPHVYFKNAFLVDNLLKQHLPDSNVFDEIYIE